jgi:glyoxylase-like metal-dependent hydrolase (beta-lactamase superfamily II)
MALTIRRTLACIGVGLGLLLAASPSAAQTGPMAAPPAAQPFKIGALSAWALHDAQFGEPNDGTTFGLGEPPAAVAEVLRKAGAPTDRIVLSVNALLVKAPGHVMLFDTGLGPRLHGGLMGSLALTGVTPAQVTDILITHSHGDHVGGLVTAAKALAFPNATIRMSAVEWAWLKTKSPSLAATIGPKIVTFTPGSPVLPAVTPIALPGHTPGHVGYTIVSGRGRLIDIGDIAHSSIISLAKPEWKIQFDNDKDEGVSVRRAELKRLAAAGTEVFAPHFPFPGLGKIVPAGDGFIWRPEAMSLPAAAKPK